jgi:hypothetical protein
MSIGKIQPGCMYFLIFLTKEIFATFFEMGRTLNRNNILSNTNTAIAYPMHQSRKDIKKVTAFPGPDMNSRGNIFKIQSS